MKNISYPEESEFLIRGFNYSDIHNPDEGVISFSIIYPDLRKLELSLLPFGSDSDLRINIYESGVPFVSFTRSNVTSIEFQAWSNEQIVRVYWKSSDKDCAVYYKPQPKLFYGKLR